MGARKIPLKELCYNVGTSGLSEKTNSELIVILTLFRFIKSKKAKS